MANQKPKICLISMPFVTIEYPTLGIPLLQSILKNRGIDCSSYYFAELFKDICSSEIYELILADSGDTELGEWFFSQKTFHLENNSYLDQDYATKKNEFLALREQFECTVDELASRDWSSFDTIGFSCTFLQLMPSLCLSQEIRRRHPSTEIIFGGGNMIPKLSEEILKNCSWIDKIFVGEAEKSLPHYLETGETDIEGIMWRDNEIHFSGTSKLKIQEIQDLPIPDFDDYYANTAEEKKLIIQIGRGCIYNKCNFCVYCDHSAYRKGSIDNSMSQLQYLVNRHDVKDIAFIDLIMPPSAYKNLPDIPGNYSFCISSFTWSYDHLPYLRDNECTFGIESFHPEMLKLLNKEQSLIKCISILKWLKHYNVKVAYVLLYGAIHEKAEWYDEMLPLMRSITHLPPPMWCQSITHHRDNTYLTDEEYKEHSSYQSIFPESFDLGKMARIFEVNSAEISMEQIQNWSHIKPVLESAQQWKSNYLTHSSCLRRHKNSVIDTRQRNTVELTLSPSQVSLLEECDYPTNEGEVRNYSPEDIDRLLESRLLLHMEGQYLNLVEPISPLVSRTPKNLLPSLNYG